MKGLFAKMMLAKDRSETIERGIGVPLITVGNYIYGSLNGLFIWLVIFMGIDFITATTASIKEGEYSTGSALSGLRKKISSFSIIIMGIFIDYMLLFYAQIDTKHAVYTVFSSALIFTEMMSISDNLRRLDVQLPRLLRKIINTFHKE